MRQPGRRCPNPSPTRLPAGHPDVRYWPSWTNLTFEQLGVSLCENGPSPEGGF